MFCLSLARRVARTSRTPSVPRDAPIRVFSRSALVYQSAENRVEEDEDGQDEDGDDIDIDAEVKAGNNKREDVISFEDWCSAPGRQFKRADKPRNWLSKDVPFPQNPSFQPPTPISDDLKSHIYALFMKSPKENSVRALAARYHLGIKRVEAILRLKGLEQHWKKEGKVLQRGYLKAMEWHLGVTEDNTDLRAGLMSSRESLVNSPTVHALWLHSREDVAEADLLDEDIGDQMARARYERLFFEPIVEGDDPITPKALASARAGYERAIAKKAEHVWDADVLKISRDPLRPRVATTSSGSAEGRPKLKFIDVGGKWVDEKDQARREKESRRRALLRAQQQALNIRLGGTGHRMLKRRRVEIARTFKRSETRRLHRAERRQAETSLRIQGITRKAIAVRMEELVPRARVRLEQTKKKLMKFRAQMSALDAKRKERDGQAKVHN